MLPFACQAKRLLIMLCSLCCASHLLMYLLCHVKVVSMWLEGNVLGTLLNYMVEKDPVKEEHTKLMEQLRQFVERKNLTTELALRLYGHFEFQYQKAIENRASSSVKLPRFVISISFVDKIAEQIFTYNAVGDVTVTGYLRSIPICESLRINSNLACRSMNSVNVFWQLVSH